MLFALINGQWMNLGMLAAMSAGAITCLFFVEVLVSMVEGTTIGLMRFMIGKKEKEGKYSGYRGMKIDGD